MPLTFVFTLTQMPLINRYALPEEDAESSERAVGRRPRATGWPSLLAVVVIAAGELILGCHGPALDLHLRLRQALGERRRQSGEFPAPHRLVHVVPHHPRLPVLSRRSGSSAAAGRSGCASSSRLSSRSAGRSFENTPLIIDRYREVTISLDYFGDSVINSVVRHSRHGGRLPRWPARLPVWATHRHRRGVEMVLVGYVIRDNLTLNIIMLIWPARGDPRLAGGRLKLAVRLPSAFSISGISVASTASSVSGPMNL